MFSLVFGKKKNLTDQKTVNCELYLPPEMT